jgi:hypothetical protein
MSTQEEVRQQRVRYMSHQIDHAAYYCWLADAVGLTDALIPASEPEIASALLTDPHLNNIALRRWDAMHAVVAPQAGRHGLSWSLSDTVCCLKELARRRHERQ